MAGRFLLVVSEEDPVAPLVAELWGTPPASGVHVDGVPVRTLSAGVEVLRTAGASHPRRRARSATAALSSRGRRDAHLSVGPSERERDPVLHGPSAGEPGRRGRGRRTSGGARSDSAPGDGGGAPIPRGGGSRHRPRSHLRGDATTGRRCRLPPSSRRSDTATPTIRPPRRSERSRRCSLASLRTRPTGSPSGREAVITCPTSPSWRSDVGGPSGISYPATRWTRPRSACSRTRWKRLRARKGFSSPRAADAADPRWAGQVQRLRDGEAPKRETDSR